jgi:hypothetical protein
MNSPKPDHYENVRVIRQILLGEWDPIGVGPYEEAADEYDGYIPTIYRMMQEGVGVEKLAAHLGKLETISIGLKLRPETNRRVAQRLLAIMESR